MPTAADNLTPTAVTRRPGRQPGRRHRARCGMSCSARLSQFLPPGSPVPRDPPVRIPFSPGRPSFAAGLAAAPTAVTRRHAASLGAALGIAGSAVA
jgi:hypothetical protein